MSDTMSPGWPRRRVGDERLVPTLSASPTNGRVVVIDDHALLADSLVLTMCMKGIDAQKVAPERDDLVVHVIGLAPDLVLIDLFLDATADRSIDVLSQLVASRIRVVVITATPEPIHHARSVEKGAWGVISKSAPMDDLMAAVRRALRGEPLLSVQRVEEFRAIATAARRANSSGPLDTLTLREREVLQDIVDGHAAGWIARNRGISVLTVRAHIRAILTKLDAHSQLEAVSLATSHGWQRTSS